jgi:hypothetical protein
MLDPALLCLGQLGACMMIGWVLSPNLVSLRFCVLSFVGERHARWSSSGTPAAQQWSNTLTPQY